MLGYLEWSKHHMTVFAIGIDHSKTVASWQPLFEEMGIDADLLHQATKHIATKQRPRYVDGHYFAIRDFCLSVLAVEAKRARQDDQYGTCVVCGNSGWVAVPRLDAIVDGIWRPTRSKAGSVGYQEYVVTCSCKIGRRVFDSHRHSKRDMPMTLETYQMNNPAWKEHQAQRAALKREEAIIRGRIKDRNDPYSKVVNRLIENSQEAGVSGETQEAPV